MLSPIYFILFLHMVDELGQLVCGYERNMIPPFTFVEFFANVFSSIEDCLFFVLTPIWFYIKFTEV